MEIFEIVVGVIWDLGAFVVDWRSIYGGLGMSLGFRIDGV